jgi:hypothetical protein
MRKIPGTFGCSVDRHLLIAWRNCVDIDFKGREFNRNSAGRAMVPSMNGWSEAVSGHSNVDGRTSAVAKDLPAGTTALTASCSLQSALAARPYRSA